MDTKKSVIGAPLSVLLLSCYLANGCTRTKGVPITVFDREITLRTASQSFSHNRRFLDVIGVEELRYTAFHYLNSGEMKHIAGALSRHIQPRVTLDPPMPDAACSRSVQPCTVSSSLPYPDPP